MDLCRATGEVQPDRPDSAHRRLRPGSSHPPRRIVAARDAHGIGAGPRRTDRPRPKGGPSRERPQTAVERTKGSPDLMVPAGGALLHEAPEGIHLMGPGR
jgi:hypothetical protein